MERTFFVMGSLLAFLAVAIGAFGAHSLQGSFAPGMAAVYETGVQYQFYHSLAILAVAFALSQWPKSPAAIAGWLFLAGIILFSGSLYALSITGTRLIGIITPFGGLAFLAGWVVLAWSAYRG